MSKNYMDISEFRKQGYLQEVNRQFLHPLGLALEISVEDDVEYISGVWDYRGDPEGIHYDLKNSDEDRIKRFIDKKTFIDSELEARNQFRVEGLGFNIEPIPGGK